MKVTFLKSATKLSNLMPPTQPEVAIVGRSNAGKSSFLNALCGKKVAKVSQTPGKTRLINFFQVGEHYRLVDLPGYGFAARSANEIKSWQKMIEEYLEQRENLVGLVLIMDIRRKWTDDEQLLVDWAVKSGDLPILVVLNKSDKVKHQEKVKSLRNLKAVGGVEKAFVSSCLKADGVRQVEDYLFKNWINSTNMESD